MVYPINIDLLTLWILICNNLNKIFSVLITIITCALSVKPASATSLVINEFMPHPSSGNDWIEIYNPTSGPLDLTNWTLVDSTSTMKTLSGSIGENGFVTFEVSNRLNNGGDSVYLKDATGATIDNYSYSSDPGIDKSLGRSPDGGGWTILASSSRGSSNGGSSPTPTPIPTPTPSSTPSTSTSSSSSFTILGAPSQINSDQSFSASVNLSLPDSPNANFYLKGAFKKQDGSNYFGLTKVSGSWIKNNSSYSSQYPIITDSSGNWSGTLEIQPDTDDAGFTGTDDYIFKVGRYTSSGSGPTWTNESTIKITTTSTQNTVSETSSKTSGKISNSPANPTSPPQVSKINTAAYHSASIAGITTIASSSATPSANVKVANQKQTNLFIWIGSLLIVVGIGSLGFTIYKNKIKI